MNDKWISVKDQVPQQGIVCLLYQTYPPGSMFNCRADPLPRCFIKIGGIRYDGKFILYEDQYSYNGLNHVTHWMPLPTSPIKDSLPTNYQLVDIEHE